MIPRFRSRNFAGMLPVGDAYAKHLASQYLIAHDDEARDFRRMHKSVMRALPAHKAVRYIQIENKLRALRDYEHAQAMPILR